MDQILLFVLLGLGSGALIAGQSLALVLSYRGSGTVNMAVGAIAVFGAYTFYGLHTGGYLWLLPLPGLVDRIQLGNPWPLGPAVLVALLGCALLGLLVELVALYPLRTAAPLARLLSTLGVLIVIQSAVTLHFGNDALSAPAVFSDEATVELLGQRVPLDRFLLAGVVLVAAVALAALFRFTSFGLATRAAAQNEALAQVSGLSPRRLSALNTVGASVVCGLLGILAASQTQLDPKTIPLAVVPALGAALLARFTSFTLAAVAGLAMGAVQSVLIYLQTLDWFPTAAGQPLSGVADLVFFLVVVAAVVWRGDALPGRGAAVERSLPAVPSPVRVARPAVIGGVVLLVAFAVLPFGYRQALAVSLIGVVICLSLVVITGYLGLVSLLQVALAGFAGFVVCRLAQDLDVGFPWAPVLGVAASVVLGLLIAGSAFRVRGINLAIVSVSGAVALKTFFFDNPTWGGGSSELTVGQPTLFGLSIGTDSPVRSLLDDGQPSPVFGWVCAAAAILTAIFVANLRRSDLGAAMLAVRSNEKAAAAAGIDVRRIKLIGFAISSGIAGLGGVLYTYNFGSITSARFDVLTALTFLAFAYIAGITTVSGAVFAGIGVTGGLMSKVLDSTLGIPSQWQVLIGGLALVFVIARQPDGLAGKLAERRREKDRRRRPPESSGAPAVPDPSATAPVAAGSTR